MANKKHVGSSFDHFLAEEKIKSQVTAIAAKRLFAWQLAQLMEQEEITKTELACRMNTSRAALNRILDPENTSVSLHTMEKIAGSLGKGLEIKLI